MRYEKQFLLNNPDNIKELENKINFCFEVIKNYSETGPTFDPWQVLMEIDPETKQEKLYNTCINYIIEIETATNKFNEARRKAVFN